MPTNVFVLLFLSLFIACQENSFSKNIRESSGSFKMSSDSFLLKQIVEEFLSNDRVKSDIITVQCFRKNDTLQFSIVDAYPDPEDAAFLGYTIIQSHKVCILGDKFPSGFISMEFNNVPIEVTRRKEEIKNSKELLIRNSEPLVKSVCFKGMHLIECPSPFRPSS